ncbi:Fungal Zn(2)-Cys(6) binuclear cluster domain family protein [Candida albicans]|uniref:Fungal Zn(2)-Cys(6) binuclear cluster domain family protein n=1 Tax=Candida albicans TaxID=5476 RepID=A0A8H6BUN8_CANAX|nr:Fungal Zn(2)-Cys(6) binuclear cluster domain family protein [Candida albicans]
MNNDLEFSNASFDSIGGVSVSAAATGAGAGAGDYSHTNITSNFAQTNLHSSSQQSGVLPPPPSLPPPPTSLPSQQSQNQYLDVVPPQQLTNNALKTEANSPLITDSANFTTSQPQFENTILEQSPIFKKSPNMLNSTLPLSKSTPHHIYQPSSSSSSHVRHNKITKKSSLSRLNTSSKKNLRANLVHSLSTPTELDDANNNNNDIVTPPKTLSPLLRKKTSFINVKKENDIDDSHDINCKNFSIDIDDMDDEDVLSDFSQPPPPIGGWNITGYRSLSNASSTSSHGSHHGLPVMNIFRHNPDSTKPSTPSPILSTASSSSTLSNKKVVKKLRGRKSKTKMNKSSIKTEQVVNEEPQVKNYKDDNDNDNGHDHDDENGGVSSDVGTGSNSTPSTTTKGKKMKLNIDLNNGGGSGTGSGSCSDENTVKKHTRRRLLPRSKKGCWICRIKHLKCDEVTPICGGCAKFGLQCDYSSEKPAYVTDKILRQRN